MRSKRLARVLATVVIGALMSGPSVVSATDMVSASTASVGPASDPSTSIVFYKRRHLLAGTLSQAQFTQVARLKTRTWSSIAVSRDTIVMYDRRSGTLTTGFFVGGQISNLTTRTIKSGFTDIVASCDTAFFYNRNTGRAFTALASGGSLGARHRINDSPPVDWLAASCDTLATGDAKHGYQSYLRSGTLERNGRSAHPHVPALITSSVNTYLEIRSTAGGSGDWGSLSTGTWFAPSGSADDFDHWDALAATGDSFLLYRDGATTQDRLIATGNLIGGQYTYRTTYPIGAGWSIIVGGK